MKKLMFVGFLLVTMVIIFFQHVILDERQTTVDRSAAVALNKMPRDQVGKAVVECLNKRNRLALWWDRYVARRWGRNNAAHLRAYENRYFSNHPSYYLIVGRIGWHWTWSALISLEAEHVAAYDTFGAEKRLRSIFEMELPSTLIGSLRRCGVVYAGVYPDELPR